MAGIAPGTDLNTDIEKGIFDRFRSLPIGRSVPLVGAVVADVARYVTLCRGDDGGRVPDGVPGTDRTRPGPGGDGAVHRLCSVLLLDLGVRRHGRAHVRLRSGDRLLVVLPLSFGSNTFVPTDTMPGWLQAFVKVNPISHLVSTVRALMLGGPSGADLAWTLGWMGVLLVVFVPASGPWRSSG